MWRPTPVFFLWSHTSKYTTNDWDFEIRMQWLDGWMDVAIRELCWRMKKQQHAHLNEIWFDLIFFFYPSSSPPQPASTGLHPGTWLNLYKWRLWGEYYALMYPRSSCWSSITGQFLNIWFIMLQNAEMGLDQQSRSSGTLNKSRLQLENNRNTSMNLCPVRRRQKTMRTLKG